MIAKINLHAQQQRSNRTTRAKKKYNDLTPRNSVQSELQTWKKFPSLN